jgi:hypothetical protein
MIVKPIGQWVMCAPRKGGYAMVLIVTMRMVKELNLKKVKRKVKRSALNIVIQAASTSCTAVQSVNELRGLNTKSSLRRSRKLGRKRRRGRRQSKRLL